MSKTPIFSLDQKVTIPATGQTGNILATSVHLHDSSRYLVEYVNGQGNLAEDWLLEHQLQAAVDSAESAAA